MSKFSSTSVGLLVDGYDLTAALAESITKSDEALTEQTNPFGATHEGHTPVGMTKGSLVVGGGYFDETVDLLHAGIADSGLSNLPASVARVVCLFHEGHTIGNHFTGYEGAYSQKYEVLDSNGKLVKANVTYQVTGQMDEGVIVQALLAQTIDWNTTATPVDAADDPAAEQIPITSSSVANPSVITCPSAHHLVTGDVIAIFNHTSVAPDINDSGVGAWQFVGHTVTVTGATTFTIPVNVTDGGINGYLVRCSWAGGGYGYQQVTARTGVTANIGKIRHSVDNAVWNDLITFTDTASSAHAVERKQTASATTQVARYLSWDGNLTTAGSLTVFGGFARGPA